MTYRIEFTGFCIKGPQRNNNEDNLLCAGVCLPAVHEDLNLAVDEIPAGNDCWLAVFDGMGGEAKGECASFLSAEAMAKASEETSDPERIANSMNRAVCDFAQSQQTPAMGSTVAAVCFGRTQIIGFNVGDSRCYRMRDGCLDRLSEDHARVVPAGEQKLLTQHIGINESDFAIEPHIFESEYRDGDQYLLCTDGVTDQIMDRKIREILVDPASLEEKRDCLRSRLESKDVPDNSTAILVRVLEGD